GFGEAARKASRRCDFRERVSERAETSGNGPLAFWGNSGAVPARGGDDLQRVSSHRGKGVHALVLFSGAAGGLVNPRPFGDVRSDAHGLPALARAGGGLYHRLRSAAAPGRDFFSGQVARHAPLDSLRARRDSAVGTGQVGGNPLSRLVPRSEAAQQSGDGVLQTGFSPDDSSRRRS